jgi:hypothetical protein
MKNIITIFILSICLGRIAIETTKNIPTHWASENELSRKIKSDPLSWTFSTMWVDVFSQIQTNFSTIVEANTLRIPNPHSYLGLNIILL